MVPPSTVRLHSITKSQAENQALDQYLQIDTRAGSLDWFGGPMTVGPSADDAPRVYEYDPIDVQFLQPGELFRQHEIRVDVDVELPNELTSGAQVRFFGATG